MQTYRWGIIAPGNIAKSFARALNGTEGAECYAVASRSMQRAQNFAREFGCTKSYDDAQHLIDDSDVDIIYIASPHSAHMAQSMACLGAGKPTLCEKPMAISHAQASQVIQIAKQQQVFFMEAVWTRCLPIYEVIRGWLEQGRIGEIKMVQASFGFQSDFGPEHRLYNPDLAGGALLDMGIYPITLSQWVYQDSPAAVRALGHLGATGVDEQVAIALQYAGGGVSQLGTAISTNTSHEGWIYGSKGKIKIQAPFWASESASLIIDQSHSATTPAEPETINIAHRVNGYEGEIIEAQRCLHEGLLQSPKMTWNTSLSILKTMDDIRAQIGLQYPTEV